MKKLLAMMVLGLTVSVSAFAADSCRNTGMMADGSGACNDTQLSNDCSRNNGNGALCSSNCDSNGNCTMPEGNSTTTTTTTTTTPAN